MCHECGNEDEEFSINDIPEAEREEFLDFACIQVSKIMDKAENEGFLYELITEWSKERQFAFSMATMVEEQLNKQWKEEGY
jgi:hypothetical protein